MGPERIRQRKYLYLLVASVVLIGSGISGCTGVQGLLARPEYRQAENHRAGGDYQAALQQYRQIALTYPETADEALFEIGCIYAYPKNPEKDYQKSLEAFRRLVSEYPASRYQESADAFIALIVELATRDRGAPALRRQVDSLERQVESLQKQIEQMKEIDRSLEERRRSMPPRK